MLIENIMPEGKSCSVLQQQVFNIGANWCVCDTFVAARTGMLLVNKRLGTRLVQDSHCGTRHCCRQAARCYRCVRCQTIYATECRDCTLEDVQS
jgi:hypothetical protein